MIFRATSEKLMAAIRSGDAGKARAIARRKPALLSAVDEQGCVPLMWASMGGNVQVMQALVAAGADPGFQVPGNGAQAIHLAAQEGRVEAIRFLLSLGCDVNATGGNDKNTPLHFAARDGHLEACRVLLNAGAAVNARCNSMATPLVLACMEDHRDVASLLLSCGADANLVDEHSSNGLHRAAYSGDEELVRLLLDAGADATVADVRGDTPARIAGRVGHASILELLTSANGGQAASADAPREHESPAVIIESAKRLKLVSGDPSIDLTHRPQASATARFLLRVLRDHPAPRGMDLRLLRSAFAYAGAKGFETIWKARSQDPEEIELQFSEADVLQGRVGAEAPQRVADIVNAYIPAGAEEMFYDYQDWLAERTDRGRDTSFHLDEENLAALTWVGLIAQTVAKQRLA